MACGRPLGHERHDQLRGRRRPRAAPGPMVEHLLAAGRRRIATITGPLDTSGGVDRLAGLREVLDRARRRRRPAPRRARRLHPGERVRPRCERLLDQAPDLDAVFVASDLMAAGAPCRCCARPAGGVPEDVRGRRLRRLRARRHPRPAPDHRPAAAGPHQRRDGAAARSTSSPAARPVSVTVPTTVVVRGSSPA